MLMVPTSPLILMWNRTHKHVVHVKDPLLLMHYLLVHTNQDIKRRLKQRLELKRTYN